MTDLKDLFEIALADTDTDVTSGAHAHAHADPSADLARGKLLLARRTRRRVFGAAAVTAAAALVAVGVVSTAAGSPAATTTLPAPTQLNHPSGAATGHTTGAIRLVAYTGTQPPGYTVTVIPAGWVIQGSNSFALVIAPQNAPNKDPDSFDGKLVVTEEDFDPQGSSALGWSPVSVAGHAAAYYAAQINGSDTAGLVIEEAQGEWLLVQAPTSLAWTEQQMIQFGLGVTILPTSQEGKG